MKSESSVMSNRRRTIAQLLWSLRAFQRSRFPREEVLHRLSLLKAEIRPAFRYVNIRFSTNVSPEHSTLSFNLDKGLLRRAEMKHRALAKWIAGTQVRAAH
jgi:hypothetical protein